MNKIIPFGNSQITLSRFEGQEVRIVLRDGEPWFVAADVCAVLDLQNASMAVAGLDDDEYTLSIIEGSHRPTNIINEAGLYELVFRSRKPEARRFKKWVKSDVLPSIRKTGGYGVPQTLPDALRLAADLAEQKALLEAQIVEDAPKVEFYRDVAGSEDLIDMATVAKVLNIPGFGRNKLFAFLRDNNVLNARNEPYQRYVDLGWFKLIETKFQKPNGDWHINIKTMVYQRGVDGIRKLLKKETEVAA